MIVVVTRERRPSCFDTTRPTYNLLLTPVNNDLAEKLPDDLQVSKIIMMIILINYDYDNDDDLMIVAHPCKQRPCWEATRWSAGIFKWNDFDIYNDDNMIQWWWDL